VLHGEIDKVAMPCPADEAFAIPLVDQCNLVDGRLRQSAALLGIRRENNESVTRKTGYDGQVWDVSEAG
jgi:hypothetical protein